MPQLSYPVKLVPVTKQIFRRRITKRMKRKLWKLSLRISPTLQSRKAPSA